MFAHVELVEDLLFWEHWHLIRIGKHLLINTHSVFIQNIVSFLSRTFFAFSYFCFKNVFSLFGDALLLGQDLASVFQHFSVKLENETSMPWTSRLFKYFSLITLHVDSEEMFAWFTVCKQWQASLNKSFLSVFPRYVCNMQSFPY